MFKEAVVVVTGGASGIGLAAAQRFIKLGAKATYVLDVQEPLEKIAATYLKCDVRQPEQIREAMQKIQAKESKIDVLFANAGTFALGDIEETDDATFARVLDTNVRGTWYSIQAVLPGMRERKRGAIILTGSDQSLVGRKKSAAYGLTKGAIGQLTKSLALDYAPFGIRVNCVCPAAVDTPLCHSAIADWARKYGGEVAALTRDEHALQPSGRMGTANDVANLVTFLASEDAGNITGTLISTDGGYVAQ